MVGERPLSEKQCKQAKPSSKMYYLSDGSGLRLRCRPDGGKTWIYQYYFNKKEKSAGIGSYRKITLNSTRTVAADNKALVADGKNPVLEKRVRSQQRLISE
ncbi:MAG: hypothetical protein CMK42_09195 [Porticoccaceae bacterium]|mgnify:CR=1 FL=1|nr:hypothetical protein [Porticoccaceae bacterium]